MVAATAPIHPPPAGRIVAGPAGQHERRLSPRPTPQRRHDDDRGRGRPPDGGGRRGPPLAGPQDRYIADLRMEGVL